MSGIFGVVSKKDCRNILLFGTDYHSHLGTQYGGVAVYGEKGIMRQIHNISQSQFKSKFYDDIKNMKGNKGIGVISGFDEQPIYVNSKFGPFCIVTMGYIENSKEIMEEFLSNGFSFSEMSKTVNLTELVAKIITTGNSIVDGIEKIYDKIHGSCSMLILNKDGIHAARDKYGYTPLTIGQSPDAIAVTTETAAFPNNDFKIVKSLNPGEIVLIKEDGMKQISKGAEKSQICSFLWIYTGFPASTYEGINVETVREESGKRLAKRDTGLEIDLAAGVPDSGSAHAIGYAIESDKPYRRPLVKYTPGYGRSYTPPDQETRDIIAKMKLIPIKEIIDGNKVVICDDSIVRGTQLKNFTINKLWENGAKEIHVRIACPPLMYPCIFNLSTRTIHELAARRAIRNIEGRDIEDVSEYLNPASEKYKKMVEYIKDELGVTTLKYQTLEDMIDAIGMPEERLCQYCWNGKCLTK